MDILGKVFVVTGAGNGIARELTLQLLAKGAKVAGVDLKKETLAETAKLAGANASHFSQHELNITDRAKVLKFPAEVIKQHGQVDGLINVAGIIQPFVKINELDFDAIERVMNVNFYGDINTIKAFLPELLKRPEASLVNISSMGGYAPVPGQTLYGASKAAVKLLTEGLHSELMDTNVHVTTIYPGAIQTNIAGNSGVSMGDLDAEAAASESNFKMTTVDVAANVIIKAIEKNSYKAFIGSDAKMMDRLIRLMPERAAKIIYNQMKSLLG